MAGTSLSHQERERDVARFFSEVVSETRPIVTAAGFPRPQLILCFSFMDMVASYWFEYRGANGTSRERFIAWYEKFCTTKNNPVFLAEKTWRGITGERLYDLRSSLVHFFGLSAMRNGLHFSLAHNFSQRGDRRLLKRISNKVAGKHGYIVANIVPFKLFELISGGTKLMLHEWALNIGQANSGNTIVRQEHIDGMKRIWHKVTAEGAVRLDPKELDSYRDIF